MTTDGPLPTHDVLLFAGFDELDAVGPFEVLAAAGLPVRAVGLPGADRTLRAGNGMTFVVDAELGDPLPGGAARPDVLLVPGGAWIDTGGPGVRTLVDAGELPRSVAAAHADGTVVASVCTGAMILGAAGLLTGRPAVTNAFAIEDLRGYGADVRAEARVVDDGDLLTAGGPMAGIDLAIRLVERALGVDAAATAARRIEHERRGPLVVREGVAG